MTFVSWHYTGRRGNVIYQGFDNYVTSHAMPADGEGVELHTDLVNTRTKIKHGFDAVTCEIICFAPLNKQQGANTMTRLEKIIEAVNPLTKAEDIKRLNIGDLSHIGDAIEAGEEEIMLGSEPDLVSLFSFDAAAEYYQRIKSTYTLEGVEVPRPLAEEPEEGTLVCIAGVGIDGTPYPTLSRWDGSRSNWQQQALEAGLVYKNEEDSKILSTALSKLIKNAIKEALADS